MQTTWECRCRSAECGSCCGGHGWSCQQPARRAVERDEAAVASWVKETWPRAKPPRRRSGHGWSSRMKPPSR
nr:winged helix-turn-helix domain-containing protein [Streptomyces sp. Alain-F2R5]